MSAVVLDAGALIAVDRGDSRTLRKLTAARRRGRAFRTTPLIVAQAWRDPHGRQAELARFLRSVDVQPITMDAGRSAGVLLGTAETSDPVDASLVLLARDGDQILTSDPDDIAHLTQAAGLRVRVVAC